MWYDQIDHGTVKQKRRMDMKRDESPGQDQLEIESQRTADGQILNIPSFRIFMRAASR